MWSATPAWLIGLFIYLIVGLRYGGGNVESEDMRIITQTIRENFNFNILLLLPLVVVFYFAFTKKPTIPGMLLSSFVAGILAIIFQKASITDVATAMNTGYVGETGVKDVDRLISQGGMMSMMEVQLVAFTAFSFGGIMQRTGLLSVILGRVMKFTKKVWSLVLTTIASSFIRGLAAKNLSRIIEESGAIIVPLIPWSMAGVYITGVLDVSTLSYAPWAFMNYVSVVVLAIYGFTKFTMAPKIRDDETQIGS
jgi:NhaC family Na+:H+ antiporter